MIQPPAQTDSPLPPCPSCGYSQRGLDTGLCPECGRPVFRFTERAREVFARANDYAADIFAGRVAGVRRHKWWHLFGADASTVQPWHVLAGIVLGPRGIGYHTLVACGAPPDRLLATLEAAAPPISPRPLPPGATLPVAYDTLALPSAAVEVAAQLGHTWVGTEHVLLTIVQRGDHLTRHACNVFQLTPERVAGFVVRNHQALVASRAAATPPLPAHGESAT